MHNEPFLSEPNKRNTRDESRTALGPPGLLRRLAAIGYDGLLLASLVLLASFPYVLAAGEPPWHWLVRLGYQAYMLAAVFGFFGWFWTHGGQTLGMRAWRLRVVSDDGEPLSWAQAAKRFMAAGLSWVALGLGYLWCLIDPDQRTWHDRLSGSHLVLLAKAAKKRSANPAQ